MDSKNKLVISLGHNQLCKMRGGTSNILGADATTTAEDDRIAADIKFYWLQPEIHRKRAENIHSRVTSGGKFFCWSPFVAGGARDDKTCKGRSCVCLNNSIISFATLKAPRGALTLRATSKSTHSLQLAPTLKQ